ncbi:MarR family transcriptional regulator [Candidatus Pacearchaeota archaeon]|jgi:DNA-binding HxlR family transcriptional regulator|nr:MarR family transcriptional regulator [Candidatus Pacearchaeota archaeon]
MSQDVVLAALSDEPLTQKQLMQQLHIESGVLSHRLNSLMRKGLVERQTLEIRYRPFGYVKAAASDRPGMMRWPKFEESW